MTKLEKEQYKGLMDALTIVAKAREQVGRDSGLFDPAWGKLWRISTYLLKQVDVILNPNEAVKHHDCRSRSEC